MVIAKTRPKPAVGPEARPYLAFGYLNLCAAAQVGPGVPDGPQSLRSNFNTNAPKLPPTPGVSNPMKPIPLLLLLSLLILPSLSLAQRSGGGGKGGPKPTDIGTGPQAIGAEGIMWYTTWDTALAEATRSNRPIFFMAAAATCSGISGVF